MVLWEKNWNFNRIIKDKQNLDGFKAKKKMELERSNKCSQISKVPRYKEVLSYLLSRSFIHSNKIQSTSSN